MTIQVGAAEVEIRGTDAQLIAMLAKDEAAVKRFETSVDKFSLAVERKFNKSAKAGANSANKFHQSLNKLTGGLGLIPGPAGAASARLSSLLTVVGGLGPVGTIAAVGLAAVAAGFVKASTEAEKFERINLRTEAILKATGFASGKTADEIRDLGESIEGVTLATSEDVQQAAQRLLAFGNVAGDTFDRTLKLAQDLSAVTGDSLVSSIERLGAAFENPEQSVRRFRDIGLHKVVLLEAQALKDAGKEAEAHGVILDALAKKVGGAGEGEAKGLTGAYHRLGDAVGDFFRVIGQESGIVERQTGVFDAWARTINRVTGLFEGDKGNATGLMAKDSAKRSAEFALQERRRMDAEAKAIEEKKEATKKAAEEAERLAKQEADRIKELNKQRREAIALSETELAILKKRVPELLATGKTQEEVNEQIRFELELQRELTRLGLERGSAEGQRLAAAKQGQKDLNDELERTLENRKEIEMSIEVTPMAKDPTREAQQDAMISFNDSAAALNTELMIQQGAFHMTAAEAAAFRFEQEALADIEREVGFVTDDQRASIAALAEGYGEATKAISALEAKQQSVAALNEELESTFMDVTFGAKSLGDGLADLGDVLAKAAVEALAFGKGPLAGMFGTAGGGTEGGGTAGLIGAGVEFAASLFHGGGKVGRDGSIRRVPVRAFINAPRLHGGLKADEFPAILQQGEEVTSRKDAQRSRGGSPTYVWNVQTPDADSFMKNRRQMARQAKNVLEGRA